MIQPIAVAAALPGLTQALGSMKQEFVAAIQLDATGRIHVAPEETEFPYIYREAMEVSWDNSTKTIHSPVPREWSYAQWLLQILGAAEEQGVHLVLGPKTQWVNVPHDLQIELTNAAPAA